MSELKYTPRQIEIIEAASKRIDQFGIQELTIKKLAADVGVSEAALYRHYNSKNEILHALLKYFIEEMNKRINDILANNTLQPADLLTEIFTSQLLIFVQKPAIVSVIFSEGIFQFNKELSTTLSDMIDVMHKHIEDIIKEGQSNGSFRKNVGHSILTTMIMGTMRITVLKWKLSGHKSDLIQDGKLVLSGILKMIKI